MTRTPNARLGSGRYAKAAGNPDHARRHEVAAPSDRDIEQRLDELVKPAVFAEIGLLPQAGSAQSSAESTRHGGDRPRHAVAPDPRRVYLAADAGH